MNKFREEKIFIKMKLKVNLFSSAMLEINELSTKKNIILKLNWYCIIDLLLHLSLNVSNACSQTQILTRNKPIGSILSDDPSFSIRNVFPITIFFELSLAQSEKVIKYLCFVIISMSETRKHI